MSPDEELQEDPMFEEAIAAGAQTETTGKHIEKMQMEIATLREENSRGLSLQRWISFLKKT